MLVAALTAVLLAPVHQRLVDRCVCVLVCVRARMHVRVGCELHALQRGHNLYSRLFCRCMLNESAWEDQQARVAMGLVVR